MSYAPRAPKSPGWVFVDRCPAGYRWASRELGILALSSVDVVPRNDGERIAFPHWHVSATYQRGKPRACTDEELERVRAAFDMGGAEEDNHGPGIARHLWLTCGEDREPECPCKQDEERIVEGDRVRFETEQQP